MRVTLSTFTKMTHRCVVCPMVCSCVLICTSAGLRPHANSSYVVSLLMLYVCEVPLQTCTCTHVAPPFPLQVSCVVQCPSGTYRHQLAEAIGPVPAGNGACHPCHELCEMCFGPQNTECFTCKFAAVENTTGSATVTTCLAECPSDRYLADNNICRPCHEECDGCVGQGNKMCTQCRNLRVVVTQTPALTTYECLRTCPNSSYWIDRDNNNTCILCHPLCATCVAPGNSNCTQCKAIQATPILLNFTITVDGVNRTLYTCEATLGLGGGETG